MKNKYSSITYLYDATNYKVNTTDNFFRDNPAFLYSMSGVFLVLGIMMIIYYVFTKYKIQEYKDQQLAVFRENHPKEKHKTYQQAGLYLPSWQRMKYNLPLFLGVVFIIIAIGLFIIQTQQQ